MELDIVKTKKSFVNMLTVVGTLKSRDLKKHFSVGLALSELECRFCDVGLKLTESESHSTTKSHEKRKHKFPGKK